MPVTIVPAADDDDIAKRLEGVLRSTEWFVYPRVSVRQGVVSLDGKTSSQEHKRWAGDLAEKTQDVVAVVNRIKVDTDVGSTFGKAGEEFNRLYRQAVQSWPIAVVAAIILVSSWLLAKLFSRLARHFFSTRVAS